MDQPPPGLTRTAFGAAVLLMLVVVAPSKGELPWLTPTMTLGDCEGIFWKEEAMCHHAFHDQQARRLREHTQEAIANLGEGADDACDPTSLNAAYSKREESWEAYASSACDVTCHCDTLSCGSGHPSCFEGCAAENAKERVAFLRRELEQGLELWGCTVHLTKSTKTLRTPSFEVTLRAKCARGFFDCEDVEYQGRSWGTTREIRLDGKRLRECDIEACRWLGYRFENEGFVYGIEESGLLTVWRVGNTARIVEEQGVWE